MTPARTLPAPFAWTFWGRFIVFWLSASSIWCLLAEMYHLTDMRTFTLCVLVPATVLLILLALIDQFAGDQRLARAVWIGLMGGLLAAVAYDVFRLPWVIGFIDKVGPDWLRLPLFKVFPRFGALILSHPFTARTTDSQFTLTDHVVGWIYHFSNGMSFGVMYLAIIGDPRRHTWLWAIVMAVGLEVALIVSPYVDFFGITMTTKFVIVTLTAHLIFGVTLGLHIRSAYRARDERLVLPGTLAI